MLYPVFVGLALSFMSSRFGDENLEKVGRGLVRWGGFAFLGAAAFFELIIQGGGGILGGLAAPGSVDRHWRSCCCSVKDSAVHVN